MKCAFVAVAFVATAERFENENSIFQAVAGTAGSSAGKRAVTDCWKVTAPAVSARCSDTVVRSASVEDNQASLVLMALVNLRTVRISLINKQ